MIIAENISLKPYNTFRLEANTKYFAEIHTRLELDELLNSGILSKEKFLIMGGGSNLVFANDFSGIIVKMSTKGISTEYENNDEILLKVEAGEKWEHFVNYCIFHNYGGVENLAAIPGTVGASAVQNIGAYGSEAKDVIAKVEAVEIVTGKQCFFELKDCCFDYRSSIFKTTFKNQFIITSVYFRLSKKPSINVSYNALKQELQKLHIPSPTIKDIATAVKEIRKEKLPSPEEIGSVGSFFKNPVISKKDFELIEKKFPQIVYYPDKNGVKLAAAYLIDYCGWKGKNIGQAGVHNKQALVLVNLGNATSQEVLKLSEEIQKSVWSTFGVKIEPEADICFL